MPEESGVQTLAKALSPSVNWPAGSESTAQPASAPVSPTSVPDAGNTAPQTPVQQQLPGMPSPATPEPGTVPSAPSADEAPPPPQGPPAKAPLPQQQVATPEQMQQLQDNLVLEGVYNESLRRGLTPDQAGFAVRQAATQLQTDRQTQALENHPVVRQLAANKAVEPYTKYGVAPEDVISAPTPEAMVFAAYTLAQKNYSAKSTERATNLSQRAAGGNDTFEGSLSGGAGSTIDYKKSPGKTLLRNALANIHR